MYDENGPGRARGNGEPAISRRTWVRTAANAAWTVPLLSIATTAPAHAAASGLDGLEIVGTFYLHDYGDDEYGHYTLLAPVITVTNPTARDATDVEMFLAFPLSDFTGANDTLKPPTPQFTGNSPIPSTNGTWMANTVRTSRQDTVVKVRLSNTVGVAAGQTSIMGGGPWYNPFGIVFTNHPAVTSVTIQVTASMFPDVLTTLLKVDEPT